MDQSIWGYWTWLDRRIRKNGGVHAWGKAKTVRLLASPCIHIYTSILSTSVSLTHIDISNPTAKEEVARMAFVHRKGRDVPAEGFLDQYEDIGPGSYQKVTHWGNKRPSCVAFHTSSQQRGFFSQAMKSPGPGSFDITLSKGKCVGAPFKSKTSRFHKKQILMGPGPGDYDVSSAYRTKKSRVKSSNRRRPRHYRTIMPAIPSIPSSSQKYGYEETKEGELVPLTVSLGRKNDLKTRRRRPRKSPVRAVSFGLSKTQRFATPRGVNHPGPGSYNTNIVTKPKLLLTKASAAFESRSKRVELARSKDSTPAVGTYNISSRIGCRQTNSKHQFFGMYMFYFF